MAQQVQFIDIGASYDELFIGALPEVGRALEVILASIQPPVVETFKREAAE